MVRQQESPRIQPRDSPSNPAETSGGGGTHSFLSPRFKSAAAMAGWDEESLLMASLIVDDTPEQDTKRKQRSVLRPNKTSSSPPTNSSRRVFRKRRAPRKSPVSIPMVVLDLDIVEESGKEKVESEIVVVNEETESGGDEKKGESSSGGWGSSHASLPCIDKLRDELSCAICLDICFEPSTTPCGHSFCKNCLRSAADKCGMRCPKCRQLISNGRFCTVNTVLWNTIQLLFPQDIEARKAAGALNRREEEERKIPDKAFSTSNSRNQSRRVSGRHLPVRRRRVVLSREEEDEEDPAPLAVRLQMREAHNQNRVPGSSFTRPARIEANRTSNTTVPNQDEDAALALRLQREEFMEAFRGSSDQSNAASLVSARANIRAMAARATSRSSTTRFL